MTRTEGGVSNIWRYPLDGHAPRHVTRFTSDLISNFAVSGDGTLAVFRGRTSMAAVLIRDLR